jgi:DNA-binding NtrC family response regulator
VQAIAAGEFREDLFHRLNVVQFHLPPLRERGDDVRLLAEHFLKSFRASLNKNITTFTPAAHQKMLAHRWPGNIRELRNVVERALILETGQEVQASSLPDFALEGRLQKTGPAVVEPDESLDAALERLERELIQGALEQSNFSLTRAAGQLKLTRHSLRYRMQRLNMTTDTGDTD